MKKLSRLLLISVFGTLVLASTMGGHIPIQHNENTHANSICWGYAMGRAFGKDDDDIECPAAQTWFNSIDESYFPFTANPTLSGVTAGDIVVWAENGVRAGLQGYAAYVTAVNGSGYSNISVRQVPYEGGNPENKTVAQVVSQQGSNPVGYHRGGGQTVTLTFRNSFNGGMMYVGKNKLGEWMDFNTNPTFSKLYAPTSQLDIRAITPQWHGGYKWIFQYWSQGPTPTSLEQTITVPNNDAEYVAVFIAEFHVTAQNQFGSCVSGNPGTIKVGGTNRSSPHDEIVMETYSTTLEAIDQTHNGVDYDFTQWSDGNTSRQRTVYPSGNVTLTASFTVDRPRPMSDYNLHVSSSPGQDIAFAWNQHPDANVNYQVWRRIKPAGGSLGPPVHLTTLNNNVTFWTDYGYQMTNGYTADLLQYDIRSHYSCGGVTVSAYDDYITVFGDEMYKSSPESPFTSAPVEEYGVSAHPNPFNPTTTISYQLVEDAMISLAIFDMQGKRVLTLVNSEKAAEHYSLRWNGVNEAGQKAASGLYIYRLVAAPISGGETFRASGKLLLTK